LRQRRRPGAIAVDVRTAEAVEQRHEPPVTGAPTESTAAFGLGPQEIPLRHQGEEEYRMFEMEREGRAEGVEGRRLRT
jgi:rhodanese-related sulfurtransferase